MNCSPQIAFDRKTTLLFVILATFLFCLVAWFTRYGGLAFKTVPNYSDWERNTISSFLGMALVAGILFPSIALLVWGRQQQPREILGSYLISFARAGGDRSRFCSGILSQYHRNNWCGLHSLSDGAVMAEPTASDDISSTRLA